MSPGSCSQSLQLCLSHRDQPADGWKDLYTWYETTSVCIAETRDAKIKKGPSHSSFHVSPMSAKDKRPNMRSEIILRRCSLRSILIIKFRLYLLLLSVHPCLQLQTVTACDSVTFNGVELGSGESHIYRNLLTSKATLYLMSVSPKA